MTEPIRFREYYLLVNEETVSWPTCVPGAKPEPLLIPEYMFNTPEDEQTEPQQDHSDPHREVKESE